MTLIATGAEAQLIREKEILIKKRVPKSYRLPQIDAMLIKRRTKKEAKILEKIASLHIAPQLKQANDSTIQMEYIPGKPLRDLLSAKNYQKHMQQLGKMVAQLHNLHIIHGDLTTSNILFEKKLYIIDFGLSSESLKIEDKAVDLHLFKHALESKHYQIWEKAFKVFITSYAKQASQAKEILKRFEQVEQRGRYKDKY